MFRPYPVFIGLRYTRSVRHHRFISFVSGISILGLALGVLALIVVLSVMNGFEKELRGRILGMTAHATLYGYGEAMREWEPLAEKALANPHVTGAAPFVDGQGMLMRQGRVKGVLVRGVMPAWEERLSVVDERMVDGLLSELRAGEYGIVIGKDLAASLDVGLGGDVTLVTPELSGGIVGLLPRLRRFRVVGVFEVGMYEYDSSLALIHLEDALQLYRQRDVNGLSLLTDDLMNAPALGRQLAAELPGQRYFVVDWTQRHRNFFRALKTEKAAMFIILTLIVVVAGFSVVSMLTMTVAEKQADVAVLRTMGASRRGILLLFIVHGTIVALAGVLLGICGGVLLALNLEALVAWIERVFDVRFLPPEIYFLSELPSDLRWEDVRRIGIVAFILGVVSTLYPAWQASSVRPAEALRYE